MAAVIGVILTCTLLLVYGCCEKGLLAQLHHRNYLNISTYIYDKCNSEV